ncbi:Bax inhibitor-1/YccA family protein [Providencia sp. PROV188]|jgi:FtsH-binding integral membrane protein|uniref:BAX inhibitor (BI)-1/YccA family protein n=2 Tax=Providencia TaxID=586 RepID=A0A4R3NS11_9GAMM|nr:MULTISPECIES: Bax inhibitor-1/YccA family protein [Providencia]MTC75667.1 BAX inhibitor (BI)-1/YccA family protein [Providencia sp. wls1919]ETT02074.1 inhibitor of apoptosis-promoting Bax1 [Providencia alcalifaciens PAL-3]EUC99458.1 inhibitor of apoptosis-promoting Bax1 [Providencia alcalifaciens PAL-1]MBC5789716.1 Bax inhibitor-1/YccA family protein [Providencia sp. JUb39]MBG5881353.1 Bax inhibitor-1/YccA family protein [Providencia alcalifaciens]
MGQFDQRNDSLVQNASTGVQAFMSQVYGWMTVGLLLTAFVAWYSLSSGLFFTIATNKVLFFGMIIAELGLVMGLSFLLPKMSGAIATGMFMLYALLTGLTISVILAVYTGESVVGTFIITAVMFGALSFYGYTTKRSLTGMGNFLFMALIGLVVASLVNIWLQSSMMYWVITYGGVLLFAALTAYDTQKLKEMGEQINQDDRENMRKYSIMGALSLYLDFINLFLMLLRIFGDRR